jgi:hypothetical protein
MCLWLTESLPLVFSFCLCVVTCLVAESGQASPFRAGWLTLAFFECGGLFSLCFEVRPAADFFFCWGLSGRIGLVGDRDVF